MVTCRPIHRRPQTFLYDRFLEKIFPPATMFIRVTLFFLHREQVFLAVYLIYWPEWHCRTTHRWNWTLLWTPTTIAIMSLLCCSSVFFRNFFVYFSIENLWRSCQWKNDCLHDSKMCNCTTLHCVNIWSQRIISNKKYSSKYSLENIVINNKEDQKKYQKFFIFFFN